MMAVGYTGAFLDYSGMGEAARQFVAALNAVGVRVVGRCERYAPAVNLDFSAAGRTAVTSCGHHDPYRIQILHVTPDEFPRLKEDGVYTVAHFFWETDRLPPVFVKGLEVVDEIWTGTQATADAIRNSRVEKPIFVFPQPTQTVVPDVAPYNSSQTENFDGYLFYSIFEWTARKNPDVLVNAFMSEFRGGENVGLLLKTYFQSFAPANIPKMLEKVEAITRWYKDGSPQIFLELNPLNYNGIQSIHLRGDCYVSPHRGEGWGIPIVEAMAHGNPVIVTGYGGVAEYIEDGVGGFLLPYTMEPVSGMSHATRYYCSDQKWAAVKQADVQSRMREIYEFQEAAKQMGRVGKALCAAKFNHTTVGNMMKQRLETIEASL